ncbi:hypothetical protein ElyMa_001467200 [Elysia marginata]|uniref:Uncharacterized protein n=1 Tax=Elysia marginata TaxID=1093978 RepID=A0AAV4J2V7_9GAST|nr:hypothetical protein ElyMa_001467200 [Elysia marginata]
MPNSKRRKNYQSDDYRDNVQLDIIQNLKLLENKIEKIRNFNTQKLLDELEHLRGIVHDLQVENFDMTREVKHLKEEIAVLVDEIQETRQNITESKQNQLEQHIRRNNLRIFGVSDKNKYERAEETTNIVK